MTWTYTPDFNTSRDQIRLRIGDTISTDPLLTDEEIAQFYTASGNSVAGASIMALRSLAAKYSRMADISVESVSKRYSQKAANYLAMATALEVQGSKDGLNSAGIGATGIDIAEMDAADQDTNRPKPQIVEGMFDNPEAGQLPIPHRQY